MPLRLANRPDPREFLSNPSCREVKRHKCRAPGVRFGSTPFDFCDTCNPIAKDGSSLPARYALPALRSNPIAEDGQSNLIVNDGLAGLFRSFRANPCHPFPSVVKMLRQLHCSIAALPISGDKRQLGFRRSFLSVASVRSCKIRSLTGFVCSVYFVVPIPGPDQLTRK